MGCRDEGRAGEEYSREARELKDRLDAVTRMLCGVLTQLETAEPVKIGDLPTETQEWWSAHKTADAKRLATEAEVRRREQETADLRVRARAKLTPEERKALGLT